MGHKETVSHRYTKYLSCKLSDFACTKEGLYHSQITDLSLKEFVMARRDHCQRNHSVSCGECKSLIAAAEQIDESGIVPLRSLFTSHFLAPNVKYKSDKAIRRMMQLPVAIFPMEMQRGQKTLFVTKLNAAVNYGKLGEFLKTVSDFKDPTTQVPNISRETLKIVCDLASSEKDKQLIKYAVCCSSNISTESARKAYGISNLMSLKQNVANAVEQALEIRDAVNHLSSVRESCILEELGIPIDDSKSDSDKSELSESDGNDSCDDMDSEKDNPTSNNPAGPSILDPDHIMKGITFVSPAPANDHLLMMLRENNHNWFAFVEELRVMLHSYTPEVLSQVLLDFSAFLPFSDLSDEEERLVEESRQAFLMTERIRATREENDIESDSESDDPEDWVDVGEGLTEKMKSLVRNEKRKQKKRDRRRFLKLVAERSVLKRKVPKRASKLLKEFPNLGKDIEDFVQENRIGADAWRRTGVATFDGNVKIGPRVTYRRIKEHLERKYQRKFSYGAIVQLSVVRNKRRRSSKRYWGAAQITCRRARKGFNVKLNPDAHWSSSFYKGLDKIQFEDGKDKCIINRDDAAGFRLDTTYTHKQHKAVSDANRQEVTTRTDYVNKYASVLQVTSYLIQATKTTPQMSAGVVKAHILYPKDPSQHAADLVMVENDPDFKPCLKNKPIDCIRVDGAADEGPAHTEVQFMWTERHLEQEKVCTLVTTRCSGSSYLNRVELQNGCLSVAHSNIFIPSTIHGSNFGQTAAIDYQQLERNLDSAADVYISKCNNAPFGESSITLFKGSRNDLAKNYKSRRPHLITFLKGSQKDKKKLMEENPTLFEYFTEIWKLRDRHMVKGLPNHYIFQLLPCYEEECIHPVCKRGQPEKEPVWYDGGPPLSYLPVPIADPKRCWGQPCDECKGFCTGHYLKPDDHMECVAKYGTDECVFTPPKDQVEAAAKSKCQKNEEWTETEYNNICKTVLLSTEDVRIWIEHVGLTSERRKAGAKKAAETRARKRKDNEGKITF